MPGGHPVYGSQRLPEHYCGCHEVGLRWRLEAMEVASLKIGFKPSFDFDFDSGSNFDSNSVLSFITESV